MRFRRLLMAVAVMCLALPIVETTAEPTRATAAASEMNWYVFGSGPAKTASANYNLGATFGHVPIGSANSTNYRLNLGFWQSFSCCVGLTGNVDCDPTDGADISDLTALIDNLYISFTPLCCSAEANTDGSVDGNIDISDLTALIDYLYISFTLPAVCR